MQNLKLLKTKQPQFEEIPTIKTKKQTMGLLHISKATLDRWVYQKKLNKIKIGRKIFFAESDIKDLINKGYNG